VRSGDARVLGELRHYELAAEEPTNRRVAAAFHELALAI
jgi:hypothetical protein